MPASRRPSLLAWIAAYPGRAFAGFLALHAAVWTALPTLLYPNLPLDLIEALTYGREWQLGYDKLPPLPWWLVETAYLTIGHDFAYYLLAQVAVVAAFALVYRMARPLIGPLGALVAVLIIDGLHYLNYTSAKFNHDVVQLPFWALAGFALHRALRGRQVADCRGAHHHGAASGLAGAQRLSAFRLCRTPRAAVAWLDRPCLASAAIRHQPVVFSYPLPADRSLAVFSAHE
jgi:4-amino-4-deoxy-L-arabinose transferase-like glycosyltransferase